MQPVQLRLKLCALPFLLRCIRNNSRKARRSDPRQRLCGSNLDRPRHRRRGGVGCQACVEEANHRHRRLLRACRERPRGRRAAANRVAGYRIGGDQSAGMTLISQPANGGGAGQQRRPSLQVRFNIEMRPERFIFARRTSADFVAKVFLAFDREILIQDRARTSNNDSKEPTLRFDCYKFLFHRACLATFATQSLKSDHRRSTCDPSLSAQKLSHASQQNLSFDHLVYLGNHASTNATGRPLTSLYSESL